MVLISGPRRKPPYKPWVVALAMDGRFLPVVVSANLFVVVFLATVVVSGVFRLADTVDGRPVADVPVSAAAVPGEPVLDEPVLEIAVPDDAVLDTALSDTLSPAFAVPDKPVEELPAVVTVPAGAMNAGDPESLLACI